MDKSKNLLATGGGSINPTPPSKPRESNLTGESDETSVKESVETLREPVETESSLSM